MRAVNLLPADLRRAGAGGGSGSAAGAYALLAGLAVAVLVVAAWSMSARQVKDREAEVASLNAEASAAEAQAGNLSGYEETVKVAKARRTSVVELIEKRFDWSEAFEEVSRTIPGNVWLTTMTGTVRPGISLEGSTGNTQRAAHNGAAIELGGCTTSQDQVAALMSRLRAMKGVSRVGLTTSEKAQTTRGASNAAGKTSGDCTAGSDQRPRFNLVIFYGDSAPATTPGAAGTTPAAGQTQSGDQGQQAPANATASASGGNQ